MILSKRTPMDHAQIPGGVNQSPRAFPNKQDRKGIL